MGAQEQPTELYKVGLGSVRFLMAVGDLFIGWRLLVNAEVALAALDGGTGERDFYDGKVAVAAFFAREVLPRLTADRAVIAGLTDDAMAVAEAAF
ncbi:hypothetical protein ATM97_01500 [Nocardia sp. MH4]|nr:hypothetical protein [Nocardia sp. MH4]